MQASELKALLKKHLGKNISEYGWVNYSGLDVLKERPGGYYIMGLNPGVDDSNVQLNKFEPPQKSDWSAYLNQCWKRHKGKECRHMEGNFVKKRSSHQRQVIELADHLKTEVTKIFSANAIFVATNQAHHLTNPKALWDCCWPIHQEFLIRMKPKMIICLGHGDSSSFSLLQDATKAEVLAKCDTGDSKNGVPRWKKTEIRIPLSDGTKHKFQVIGLPHPSRSGRWGTLTENYRRFAASNGM